MEIPKELALNDDINKKIGKVQINLDLDTSLLLLRLIQSQGNLEDELIQGLNATIHESIITTINNIKI